MYGLPQSGRLAQQRLVKHLSVHGYTETSTPCLFRHTSNGTVFALFVGIKYTTREGADHLIRILQLLIDTEEIPTCLLLKSDAMLCAFRWMPDKKKESNKLVALEEKTSWSLLCVAKGLSTKKATVYLYENSYEQKLL
jgi:hypothetical protein